MTKGLKATFPVLKRTGNRNNDGTPEMKDVPQQGTIIAHYSPVVLVEADEGVSTSESNPTVYRFVRHESDVTLKTK